LLMEKRMGMSFSYKNNFWKYIEREIDEVFAKVKEDPYPTWNSNWS